MALIRTVLGDIPPESLGPTLTHEHLVVDLRRPHPGYADTLPAIADQMLPHLELVREQGIRTIVECTPTHLGRHVEAYCDLSRRSGLHVVMACGTYRDAWIVESVRSMSPSALADWYLEGIRQGAGLIKLGCDPDGPSEVESRCARAAGAASATTGCLVACHLGCAAPAWRVLDEFEAGGGDPSRFVVVHLQAEQDLPAHTALARRGAWLGYDSIGAVPADEVYIDLIRRQVESGRLDRVLISQDACAYLVGDDGTVSRHHRLDHLLRRFIPALRDAGFGAEEVETLLVRNPARALAMRG